MTPKQRVAEVAALPHVKAWLRRFERLAKDVPPEVMIYVASGTPTILALDPEGHPFETTQGGMMPEAIVATLPRGRWDGGDW